MGIKNHLLKSFILEERRLRIFNCERKDYFIKYIALCMNHLELSAVTFLSCWVQGVSWAHLALLNGCVRALIVLQAFLDPCQSSPPGDRLLIISLSSRVSCIELSICCMSNEMMNTQQVNNPRGIYHLLGGLVAKIQMLVECETMSSLARTE